MANIKSAKKRILQNEKRSEINKQRRSLLRSKIKNINSLISLKKTDEAKNLFVKLEPYMAKSISKGLYKKNTVSRILSRIAKKIKLIK